MGILETLLRFVMQGEDVIERTNSRCVMCLYLGMQEEDILDHADAKCHLCQLNSTCRPLCNIGIHLINIVEHIHAKILVRVLY